MGNFYNAIGSIAKSAIVVVFCCLILAQNLHASESLNVSELREATNYPIPCHQIEAFHYVYSVSNLILQNGDVKFIFGVSNEDTDKLWDLIDQPYRYGQKYYFVPYVDIDNSDNHQSTIKSWVIYRAYKNFKLIQSKVPGKFPDPDAAVVYRHPKYDFYSELRVPQKRFGLTLNRSQLPYRTTVIEKLKPKTSDLWGKYVPDWNDMEMISDSQRWENEYAVNEICYPTAVKSARDFTSDLGVCDNAGYPEAMSTDLNDYTEGDHKPQCMAHFFLRDVLGQQREEQADFDEMILEGVILRSLPFVGTAYTATQCESFEDAECWSDVRIGVLSDVGSTLIPITKVGRLASLARVSGKVMVGVAMAENIFLTAKDLSEGRYVDAMARVVSVGFNMVELKLSPGKRVLGGRKGATEIAPKTPCPDVSGSTNGPRTTVKRSGRPWLCDLFNKLPCADTCFIFTLKELDEVELQRFLAGIESVDTLYRRAGVAERSGEAFSAIDELLRISDRTEIVELAPISVDINDLRRWAKDAAGPEDLANKIETHLRREILQNRQLGTAPEYDPRNGGTIKLARTKISTRSGVRDPDLSDPLERALKAIENKISVEEFHHSVGRKFPKGLEIPSTVNRMKKFYYPSNRGEINGFLCWLEKAGQDELEALLKQRGFIIPQDVHRGKTLLAELRQQVEEVDTLISLQKSGAIVTDANVLEYEARFLYTIYEKAISEIKDQL